LRLAEAGVVDGLDISSRKPDWMRAPLRLTDDVIAIRKTMRDLDLVTVCEEAGCPNLSECWAERHRHVHDQRRALHHEPAASAWWTRATRSHRPAGAGAVAEAVERMGLRFAVVTAVAATTSRRRRRRVRRRDPCHPRPHPRRVGRGADPGLQGRSRRARVRLQRATGRPEPQPRDGRPPAARRPTIGAATPARSSVLARAKAAGLTTKSS
jgi:hypothetical protein